MNTPVRPPNVGAPSANYELAVLSTMDPDRPSRQLHTSGVGPVRADGSVPEDIDEQAEVVWSTLSALLASAGMAPSDVVQVTTFVVDPGPGGAGESAVPDSEDSDGLPRRLASAMAARDSALSQHRCASVLVPVPALATATWKLEVAVVAISDA